MFPNKRVIVPEEPVLAVLKGAVIFGHKSEYILSRIVRYTYGVECYRNFDENMHDPARKVVVDGIPRCTHIFNTFVQIGSTIEIGSKITQRYYTVKQFQPTAFLPVLQSTCKCPKYTDEEGCKHLETLRIKIPNPTSDIRTIEVNFMFGLTELKIRPTDVTPGIEYETLLDII